MTLFAIRGREDLLRVRFATSPVWEAMAAVRTLVDERAAAYHRPWRELVAERAGRLDLAPLLAVQAHTGYVPDFLTPPPRRPAPRLRDQLAAVRATPAAQVRRELERSREQASGKAAEVLDGLLDLPPAAARDLLAERLHEAWHELVLPFWPRVRALLDADLDERSRTLTRHGLERTVDELSARIAWSADGVELRDGQDAVVELGARGLVLMPSAFIWPAVVCVVDEPWQPTLVYPVRGIAELWRRPPAPAEPLSRLLGSTRALLLTTLDRPLSTTALAGLTELSPAGVSRHLVALRDAGLLTSARHGHEVRYARTPLGRELVRSGGG